MKARTHIGVGSLILATALILGLTSYKKEGYVPAQEWQWEMQVGYNGVFSQLVDETQRYIDSIAPTSGLRALPLVHECVEHQVPVALALAQGHVESHFGTRGLAKRTKSVWNVGAFDGADSTSALNKYRNPNEATRPYVELIDRDYLNGRSVEDLLEHFVNRQGKRYASDPNYEQSVRLRYDEIVGGTKVGVLQDKLEWYLLRMK